MPNQVRTPGEQFSNANPDELRGLPIEEALLRIAQADGGEILSCSARRVLIDAGVIKHRRASSELSNALRASPFFERTGIQGRWRRV